MSEFTRTFITAVIASIALSLGAMAAETFTVTSTSEVTSTISVPTSDGGAAIAVASKGNAKIVNSDGSKANSTFVCQAQTRPPSEIFRQVGVCDVTDSDGTFGILFGCNFTNKEMTAANCWGGMVGKSGSYEGRSGTMSWAGADGASSGTGQWN